MNRKRRFFLIDRQFQTGFSLSWLGLSYLLGISMAFLGIAGTLIYKDYVLTGKLEQSRALTHAVTAFLVCNIIFIFWLLIALIIINILQSHRLVGAIFRMRKAIDEALSGDNVVQVELRPKDYFKEMAGQLNKLLSQLRQTRNDKLQLLTLNRDLLQTLETRGGELPLPVLEMAHRMKQEIRIIETEKTFKNQSGADNT